MAETLNDLAEKALRAEIGTQGLEVYKKGIRAEQREKDARIAEERNKDFGRAIAKAIRARHD